MGVVPHQHPQPLYGGTRQIQARNEKVRSKQENKTWIARSSGRTSSCSNYEPSPRREGKHHGIMPPPSRSLWNDNEMKRKRRVAKYKFYEAEGKFKSSLKEGFRRFKNTCMKIVTIF